MPAQHGAGIRFHRIGLATPVPAGSPGERRTGNGIIPTALRARAGTGPPQVIVNPVGSQVIDRVISFSFIDSLWAIIVPNKRCISSFCAEKTEHVLMKRWLVSSG